MTSLLLTGICTNQVSLRFCTTPLDIALGSSDPLLGLPGHRPYPSQSRRWESWSRSGPTPPCGPNFVSLSLWEINIAISNNAMNTAINETDRAPFLRKVKDRGGILSSSAAGYEAAILLIKSRWPESQGRSRTWDPAVPATVAWHRRGMSRRCLENSWDFTGPRRLQGPLWGTRAARPPLSHAVGRQPQPSKELIAREIFLRPFIPPPYVVAPQLLP